MDMEHLHENDYRLCLPILLELLGRWVPDERIPFSTTANGVELDWEALETGPLSSSEKMTVRLAHAIAQLEQHGGGFPGDGAVGDRVLEAIRVIRGR